MPFAYPWFLLVALAIIAGGWYLLHRQESSNSSWGKHLLLMMRNWIRNEKNIRWRKWLLFAALICFSLAALRPQWGQKENVIRYEGLDIVFALDVSRSMQALDFSTSTRTIDRLKVSKELIKNFVQNRYQDRVSLITFAGESFVSVPMTFDREMFLNFLETAGPDDVSIGGTNLAEAIGVALERLTVQAETQRGKAIVLITDGDQTVDRGITSLATIAKQKNVPIFTVGIGSTEGVRIPEGRDVFGKTVYIQYQGKDVVSKLNEETLKTIAKTSGGAYFHAEEFGDLKKVAEYLNELPTDILEKLNITDQEERYQWFLLLGFFCFLGYVFLPEGRMKSNFK